MKTTQKMTSMNTSSTARRVLRASFLTLPMGLILGAFLTVSAARVGARPPLAPYIQNRDSDLCLGVRGVDNHRPGTGAEVYHCIPGGGDPGRDNQWDIIPISGSKYSYIKNRDSGLCLGVRGVDNHRPGTGAEVNHCIPGGGDPGHDNQWDIIPISGSEYSYIKNRDSGLCLGVRGVDNHRAGTEAEVNHCNPGGGDPGHDNQWY